VLSDLQAKAERYQARAIECHQAASEAPYGPQRVFLEVLADYYGELARDFRQILAKRSGASLPVDEIA
jgi:hypothetical protein